MTPLDARAEVVDRAPGVHGVGVLLGGLEPVADPAEVLLVSSEPGEVPAQERVPFGDSRHQLEELRALVPRSARHARVFDHELGHLSSRERRRTRGSARSDPPASRPTVCPSTCAHRSRSAAAGRCPSWVPCPSPSTLRAQCAPSASTNVAKDGSQLPLSRGGRRRHGRSGRASRRALRRGVPGAAAGRPSPLRPRSLKPNPCGFPGRAEALAPIVLIRRFPPSKSGSARMGLRARRTGRHGAGEARLAVRPRFARMAARSSSVKSEAGATPRRPSPSTWRCAPLASSSWRRSWACI